MKFNLSKIGIVLLIALVIIVFKISNSKEESKIHFVKTEKTELIQNFTSKNQDSTTLIEKILKDSKSFLGVPHQYGGQTKQGMDCSGLVQLVFKNNDINLPRSSADQSKLGKELTLEEVIPGDLLFFITTRNSTRINHVGLVTNVHENGIEFIHTSSSKGVIISSLSQNYWSQTFVMAKRILQ